MSKDKKSAPKEIYEKDSDVAEHEKSLRLRVASLLQIARWQEGVSQTELADRLGTKKTSISRIENGAQNITVDYIGEYAAALGRDAVFTLRKPFTDYGNRNTYYLKLYDDPLLQFSIERRPCEGISCEVIWVDEEKKHLLPLDLEVTSEGIKSWLKNRTIPKNREMVGEVLSSLRLKMQDIKGIIDVCYGLSLNDSYWVVQPAFDGRFADYNLYENEFTRALSLIAYTGAGFDVRSRFRTSPELTTGGMLRKAWRFFDKGDIWMYKGGSFGFSNTGNEPYSEFYASQIAKRMGINAVEYELENWRGILASRCRLLNDIDTSYIPVGQIVKNGGIQACLNYYMELGEEFYQQLVDMLVFDAVIINEDRHFGNFGLLRDNRSGKIIAPAPVFDNGISLLCYAIRDDFDNLEEYVRERTNPYGWGNEFMPLARRLKGPRQNKMLRKLLNFRFEESDVSNPPTWRKTALERLVQDRAAELLESR